MGNHARLWVFYWACKTGRAGQGRVLPAGCLWSVLIGSAPGATEKGMTTLGNWSSWDGVQQNLSVWTNVTLITSTGGEQAAMEKRPSWDSDLHPYCIAHSIGWSHSSGDGSLQVWSLGACSPCRWWRLTQSLLTPLFSMNPPQSPVHTPTSYHPSPLVSRVLLHPAPTQGIFSGFQGQGVRGRTQWLKWSGLVFPHALPVNVEHKLSILFPSGLPALMSWAFSFNKILHV